MCVHDCRRPQRPAEGAMFSGAGVTGAVAYQYGYWGLSSDLL